MGPARPEPNPLIPDLRAEKAGTVKAVAASPESLAVDTVILEFA